MDKYLCGIQLDKFALKLCLFLRFLSCNVSNGYCYNLWKKTKIQLQVAKISSEKLLHPLQVFMLHAYGSDS